MNVAVNAFAKGLVWPVIYCAGVVSCADNQGRGSESQSIDVTRNELPGTEASDIAEGADVAECFVGLDIVRDAGGEQDRMVFGDSVFALFGIPTNSDVGRFELIVTATDQSYLKASAYAAMSVQVDE